MCCLVLYLSLIGDQKSLQQLLPTLKSHRKEIISGIATGRLLDDALATLLQRKIPRPEVLITGQGTEVHYAPNLTEDTVRMNHINYRWNPQTIRDILNDIPGLDLQPKIQQSIFKISYCIDPKVADIHEIRKKLTRP